VLAKTGIGKRQPWRLLLILLAAFLALRYMYWRTVDSLLYTGPLDFVGMALLYLAEVYGFVIYMLGLFVNVWPMETRHVPLPDNKDLWPTAYSGDRDR
jgi:cellulose synthase (UDP-forming)